jgi:hypothetical protein
MNIDLKSFVIFLITIVFCTVIASIDPLALKDNVSSAVQFFYYFPAVIYLVFLFTKTHYGRRSTGPEEKTEKIKSLTRSVIQIVGTIITLAAALNLNIPFINTLRDALGYISENIDIAANAILVLIGVITTIIGYFKNSERFVQRGEQIEGKELIQ